LAESAQSEEGALMRNRGSAIALAVILWGFAARAQDTVIPIPNGEWTFDRKHCGEWNTQQRTLKIVGSEFRSFEGLCRVQDIFYIGKVARIECEYAAEGSQAVDVFFVEVLSPTKYISWTGSPDDRSKATEWVKCD
jgi:hypothetical protein